MGRRKIEIQPLTDDRNRTVTFVKRKAGLFKKAHELAVLCQVDLAVIIVGNNNKVYEFSSVDTKELIDMYQGIKPHESKSPANYGNYKKKRHLNQAHFPIDDEMSIEDENESEYDSETPEPKRQKKDDGDDKWKRGKSERRYSSRRPTPPSHLSLSGGSTAGMAYRQTPGNTQGNDDIDDRETIHKGTTSHTRDNSTASNVSVNQRPVLRVQIPIDAKNSDNNDSAKTITAIDTNLQNNLSIDPNNKTNSINTNKGHNTGSHAMAPNINKYPSFSSFKSPDNHKPITTLPLPIQNKSQTSSPSSATAPSLPMSGMTSFFGSLPQPSPSIQYPNNSILPTPILNQVINPQYGLHQNQGQHSHQYQQNSHGGPNNENQNLLAPSTNNPNVKQLLLLSGTQYHPNQGGEQSPVSGLPSRYVNELFPSPSNFYVPQDWSNSGTGMTPINTSMPQYFMNMIPSSGGQPNARAQFQALSQGQMKTENLTSPLQFMGPFSTPSTTTNPYSNTPSNGPNSDKKTK